MSNDQDNPEAIAADLLDRGLAYGVLRELYDLRMANLIPTGPWEEFDNKRGYGWARYDSIGGVDGWVEPTPLGRWVPHTDDNTFQVCPDLDTAKAVVDTEIVRIHGRAYLGISDD